MITLTQKSRICKEIWWILEGPKSFPLPASLSSCCWSPASLWLSTSSVGPREAFSQSTVGEKQGKKGEQNLVAMVDGNEGWGRGGGTVEKKPRQVNGGGRRIAHPLFFDEEKNIPIRRSRFIGSPPIQLLSKLDMWVVKQIRFNELYTTTVSDRS